MIPEMCGSFQKASELGAYNSGLTKYSDKSSNIVSPYKHKLAYPGIHGFIYETEKSELTLDIAFHS